MARLFSVIKQFPKKILFFGGEGWFWIQLFGGGVENASVFFEKVFLSSHEMLTTAPQDSSF